MQIDLDRRLNGFDLGDVDAARAFAALHGVDDDEAITGRQELLRETDAGGADFHEVDVRPGDISFAQPANDLHAEAVVAAKNITESGDQDAHVSLAPWFRSRSPSELRRPRLRRGAR